MILQKVLMPDLTNLSSVTFKHYITNTWRCTDLSNQALKLFAESFYANFFYIFLAVTIPPHELQQ